MTRRTEILGQLDRIPALSSDSVLAMRELNDPEGDLDRAMRAIACMPELTADILRLANSAHYGGMRTIGSMREALVLLGARQVAQLIMATSVAPLCRREVRGYALSPGELLEHSVAVGIAADLLASKAGCLDAVDPFTAGLLHDLGKTLLGAHLEVEAEPILALAFDQQLSFEQAEAQVLGIDHAEAGAFLLERWDLPASLVAAVRHHHQPETFQGNEQARQLVDSVHVANTLVLETGIGAGVDGLNYHVSLEAAQRLGMTPRYAEAVVGGILERFEGMRELIEAMGGRKGS